MKVPVYHQYRNLPQSRRVTLLGNFLSLVNPKKALQKGLSAKELKRRHRRKKGAVPREPFPERTVRRRQNLEKDVLTLFLDMRTVRNRKVGIETFRGVAVENVVEVENGLIVEKDLVVVVNLEKDANVVILVGRVKVVREVVLKTDIASVVVVSVIRAHEESEKDVVDPELSVSHVGNLSQDQIPTNLS